MTRADADLGFELPWGGSAMRLNHDGSVLVFHPKRAAAWRILNGETYAIGNESAPWTKTAPLTAAVVSAAWGDTGSRPAAPPPPPAVEWLAIESAGDEVEPPREAPEGTVSALVVDEDGDRIEFYDEDIPDEETLSVFERWTLFTAT